MGYEVSKEIHKDLLKILEYLDMDVGDYENKIERDILEGVVRPVLQSMVDLLIDLMSRGGC